MIHKRSQPKGSDVTVNGLPRKKKLAPNTCFLLHCLVMLKWFVEKDVLASATDDGKLIEEEQIEVRLEKISDGVLDENVDIHLRN